MLTDDKALRAALVFQGWRTQHTLKGHCIVLLAVSFLPTDTDTGLPPMHGASSLPPIQSSWYTKDSGGSLHIFLVACVPVTYLGVQVSELHEK